MADPGLKIKIGADISNGIAGIRNFLNEMKRLGKETPQATNALTNLGRVVQDAPFGFIGIANNINPLLESFQRLKAETGSASTALKSLAGSLIGPGGLGLAVSVVSSLLTVYAQRTGSAKDSLEGLAKAQADANDEAGKEIARLKVLLAAAANVANSMKVRNDAAKEAITIGKKYGETLEKENVLNGNVTDSTKNLTAAILERAKARAIENRIAELSTENLNRDLRAKQLTEQIAAGQKEINKELAKRPKIAGAPQTDVNISIKQGLLNTTQDELKGIQDESKKANKEIEDLLKTVQRPTKTTGGGETDPLKQRIDALKQLQQDAGLLRDQQIELVGLELKLASRDALKLGFTADELQQRIDGIIEKNFPVKTFEFNIEPVLKISKDKLTPNIDISKALNLDKINSAAFQPIIDNMKAVAEASREAFDTTRLQGMADLLTDTLSPAFSTFFNSIIVEGQNVFTSLGNLIKQLIQQVTVAVAKAAALAGVFSLIFPASKGGLSFLGAFKKILGRGFADGGMARGPKSGYIALLHGNELIIPENKIGRSNMNSIQPLSNSIRVEVVGKLNGQDIYFSQQRVITSMNRL